jgi:hypothetical protein
MGAFLAIHHPAHWQENVPRLLCPPLSHRHGCAGMNQQLLIARKRGHVIEEDQCVNTAFLMQGIWLDAGE